ncbi:MAG: NAD-dependent epimerase/dehydratase family protein [Planctomycetota bacterium]
MSPRVSDDMGRLQTSPPLFAGFRVLVTGGLGFIGSGLARSLVLDGYEVTILDDGSAGDPGRLEGLDSAGRLHLSFGSVLDRRLVRRLVEAHDVVFHLAAVVGVRRVLQDPQRTWDVNARGAAVVIEETASLHRPLYLFSSSEVYGPRRAGRLTEEHPRRLPRDAHPRWIYGLAKQLAEDVAQRHAESHGLAVMVLRPFNVTGPGHGEASGMVIPSFVGCALRGDPLVVHGSGRQKRVFLHIDDAIRAVRALAALPPSTHRVVNVGGLEEVSMEDLARRVCRLLGSASELRRVSYAEAYGQETPDFERRIPDIGRLRQLTGFLPSLGLDRMILDLARDFGFVAACAVGS